MIRTQISFDEDLYARAKEAAVASGISLAELCRRGLTQMLAQEPTEKPWMKFAGMFDGDATDSSSIDDVVYGRSSP